MTPEEFEDQLMESVYEQWGEDHPYAQYIDVLVVKRRQMSRTTQVFIDVFGFPWDGIPHGVEEAHQRYLDSVPNEYGLGMMHLVKNCLKHWATGDYQPRELNEVMGGDFAQEEHCPVPVASNDDKKTA